MRAACQVKVRITRTSTKMGFRFRWVVLSAQVFWSIEGVDDVQRTLFHGFGGHQNTIRAFITATLGRGGPGRPRDTVA